MPGTISQYQVVIAGQLITASLWNGMELNIINNGLIPAGIDDYSATDGEMQTATDPFPAGATSRPTSLQGELERIRYQFANITGETYWYNDPDVTIAAMKTNFDAHTHDGTSNNGPQIGTAGIADLAVTTAKIALQAITNGRIQDGAVGTTQLADAGVTTAKIADANVTAAKIAAAVAGDGLAGGAGTALSVNVDNSTIEINSDTLRVKDAGITVAKLGADVLALMSPNSIQRFSTSVTLSLGTGTGSLINNTANQTITSVDTSKSYVNFEGIEEDAVSGAAGSITSLVGKAQLTSATNVEVIASCITTGSNSNNTITVKVWYTVVEWN